MTQSTQNFPEQAYFFQDNLDVTYAEPLDPLGEAEIERSAEHLRLQVIGAAFSRLFRSLRTRQKRAALQFDGVRCAATPGTGACI